MAYLMASRRLRMEEAYEFVKSRRRIVSPNFNFMGQLLSFEAKIFGEEQDMDLSVLEGTATCTMPGGAQTTSLDQHRVSIESSNSSGYISEPASSSVIGTAHLRPPRTVFDFSSARSRTSSSITSGQTTTLGSDLTAGGTSSTLISANLGELSPLKSTTPLLSPV